MRLGFITTLINDIARLNQCLKCIHLPYCERGNESEDEKGMCKFCETPEDKR